MGRTARHALPESLYRLIWSHTRLLQIVIFGFGIGLPALAIVPIELRRRIVDDALLAADGALVAQLTCMAAGAYFCATALKLAVFYFRGLAAARITRTLRGRAVSVQSHRSVARGRRAIGATSAIVAEECEPVGAFCAEAFNTPLIEGGALLSVTGLLFAHEPLLAAIGVASLILQAVLTPLMQQRINRLTSLRVRLMRGTARHLMEASDPGRPTLFRRALRDVRRIYKLRLRMNLLKAVLKSLLKLIDNLAMLIVFGAGAVMVIKGETTLGVVVAFAAALKQVRDPWRTLLTFYRTLSDAHIKYRMITAALEGEPNRPARGEIEASLRAFEADARAEADQRASQLQSAAPSRA
jgi:ABC-type bacteriocin/lantibiotic exporter with double-glycine peptidase domain